MAIRSYTVRIEPAEEGGFVAFVPALPGCHTQGETLEETLRNAREAIQGFLEVLAEFGDPIPVETPSLQPIETVITVELHAA